MIIRSTHNRFRWVSVFVVLLATAGAIENLRACPRSSWKFGSTNSHDAFLPGNGNHGGDPGFMGW